MRRDPRYGGPTNRSVGETQPTFLTPGELNKTDKELLLEFSNRLDTAAESYLGPQFSLSSTYTVHEGHVALHVHIDCPFDGVIENLIKITARESDSDSSSESPDPEPVLLPEKPPTSISLEFRSQQGVEELMQEITATVVYQTMQALKHHNISPPQQAA